MNEYWVCVKSPWNRCRFSTVSRETAAEHMLTHGHVVGKIESSQPGHTNKR